MKTIHLIAMLTVFFVLCTFDALGQTQTPPDVVIGPGDIGFNPPPPVAPGTPVLIHAYGTNVGQTSTVCDVWVGLFDGAVFTTIGQTNGISFPAGAMTPFSHPWDTTGLPATTQPVAVNIFNCLPAEVNTTNNEYMVDFELPVELASFAATASEGGVRLTWTTESEVANLGFNIFRATSPEGPFTRINPDMMPSAGTTPYRNEYTFVDTGAASQAYYYLEDISLSGQSGRSWVTAVTPAEDSSFSRAPLQQAVAGPGNQTIRPAREKQEPFGGRFSAFKILVDESAIIQVTYADLQGAGIDPNLMELNQLSLKNKGGLLPVRIEDGGDGSFNPGDYLQFQGTFNQGDYTHEDVLSRTNVYWFSWEGGTPSPRIADFAIHDAGGPYAATLHFEENIAYSRLGHVAEVRSDHWFWQQINSPAAGSFKINLDDVATGPVLIRVMLHGNTHLQTNPDHQARLSLNGVSLGNAKWDGQTAYLFEKEIAASQLVEGENILTVEASGQGVDSFFMNWAEVDYSRSTPIPLKVSAPLEILAYDSAQLQSPENAADYVVITHGDFIESARKLAEHREAKGLRTRVVDVTDIYDEFSDGLVDYAAIRSFLKYAYENWQQPALSYVVLFGDASEDPKNNRGQNLENFIPAHPYVTPAYAYENEAESFGLSYSDHWFADLDGDDMTLEVSIGRLPVMNRTEAEIVVQKIIDYEVNSDDAAWRQRTLFINGGYNPQEESLLDNTSEHIIATRELEEPGRVYMSPMRQDLLKYSGDKGDVIAQLNRGSGLVNYLGHAGAESWDVLFQEHDVLLLDNYNRLPFVMSLTCWTGSFTGERESLGEMLLKGEHGGAIAFLGSTSAGLLAGDSLLDFELFEQLFQGDGIVTLGKVVDGAKARLLQKHPSYAEFVQTYVLLGDPALELNLGRTSAAE